MTAIKRKTKNPLRKPIREIPFPEKLSAALELFFASTGEIAPKEKIAVFDLDNTLLDGDIGDAAIAHLLDNEIDPGMKWSEYTEMIAKGEKAKAYTVASQAFTGMEDGCVRRFANVVLTMKNDHITFFEDDMVIKVIVPRPNPLMKELVHRLLARKFKIYIISASNQFLVEEAGAMFGIAKKNCYGVRQAIKEMDKVKLLQKETTLPIPFAEGKADIYKGEISVTSPLFSSGDSLSDLDYLKLTAKNGMALWRGSDSEFDIVRKAMSTSLELINFNSLFE